MNNEYELMSLLEKYQDIIIYGAKKRGHVLINRIRYNSITANLHVAVSDTNGFIAFCGGEYNANHEIIGNTSIVVKNLAELTYLQDTGAVLIAARPRYRAEMKCIAEEQGFKNIFEIEEAVFSDMFLRYDIFQGIVQSDVILEKEKENKFLQYQTQNILRLNWLREKVKSGRKIKVIFLIQSIAKFLFSSVYRAIAKKEQLFDVSIYIYDAYYFDYRRYLQNSDTERTTKKFTDNILRAKNYCDELTALGYNVLTSLDDKLNPIPLDTYTPDIVVYNEPDILLRLYINTGANCLRCYIPYGMQASNEPQYNFNFEGVESLWLFLLDTKPSYELCCHYSVSKGMNAVLSGCPALDEYHDPLVSYPVKLKDKPIVVYAPHWSIETWHNTSTFHKLYKKFAQLRDAYKDYNWVFKPHPRLDKEIYQRENEGLNPTSISYEEYLDYCSEWEESSNGTIVEDSSFIQLFKNASCLITDSYSFINLWLPTQKPCIFLVNHEKKDDTYKYFYDFIHPVLDSYYLCRTEDEIDSTFKTVVIDGIDSKAEERRKQCDNLIHNLGHAGEFIANYIERQLYG